MHGSRTFRHRLPRPARLATAAALTWAVLTEGEAASWPVGAVTVLLAVWVGRSLAAPADAAGAAAPGTGLARLSGAARFLLFFLGESVASGLSVAGRALQPRLRLHPGLVSYETRLPDEDSRVFFANAISLLPGTLTCRLEGATLTVHVLDLEAYRVAELRRLEDRVAGLFGSGCGPAAAGGGAEGRA